MIEEIMTVQCRQVIEACDFGLGDVKYIEQYLTKVTASQLISFVWRKDKKGEHNAEWFKPFIDRGYLSWKNCINCSFSEEFWYAYQIFDSICELSIFNFPAIDDMSKNRINMRRAIEASRIKNVSYIYKIFKDLPELKTVENNRDKIQMVLKSGVTNIKNL